MSDRKYRQHGYQDQGKSEPRTEARPKPKSQDNTFGPRALNMPGAHTVSRCAHCGTLLPEMLDAAAKCEKCGLELHSCQMCTYFDTSVRFECRRTILERVYPKDKKNNCQLFTMKQSVERETTSGASRVVDARQAFENLFKK
jgi:hypothetical protein